MAGRIRVGIGGWDYAPWRGTFYPPKLLQAQQLHFASRHVTAIEINATFYRLQKPEWFERWAAETPDGFVFTIKGSRYCTNRKALGEGGEAITSFFAQGLSRLGPKLGPILWQLAATKRFDADEVAAFFALLPRETNGVPLRHAIEARHESFRDPRFPELAHEAGVAVCLGEAEEEPDLEAPFVYARWTGTREEEPDGYAPAELDALAERAARWAEAGKDAYLFFIAGEKLRNPAAAQALIARLAAPVAC